MTQHGLKNNVLDQIVANKHREVVVRKKLKPIEELQQGLLKSKRSLHKALSNKQSDFIFECKKASPSKGLLRSNYDLDEILSSYKQYASAISVLTDNKYFKGSFSHLTYVSQSVKQPVLCKDFFVDSYQVYEARYFGADAILLMLSVLSDSKYLELAEVATSLNLDVLTEVHDQPEMQRAISLGAKIIGINNRNLKDLSIDLNTTEKLISSLPTVLSKDIIFISESGINTHQQVMKLAPLVNGFLVGSSIMEKNNIAQQCKALLYGIIKICGLNNKHSAIVAAEQGATYGGLIFYSKSPRFVSLDIALEITKSTALDFVGVFVNEQKERVVEIANKLDLKVIQLHGSEDDHYIQFIKKALPHCLIWKAINVKEKKVNSNIDRYLIDTQSEDSPGGTGQTFDWSKIQNHQKENIILAGGLKLDNIKAASQLNTYALDINSGVENSPGNKSEEKIIEIFKALRA